LYDTNPVFKYLAFFEIFLKNFQKLQKEFSKLLN